MTEIIISDKKLIYKWKYLNYCEKEFHKWDYIGTYEMIEKVHKGVVAWFVITKDEQIVLIKSFRIPLEQWVIEIPAWICDKIWEKKFDAVKREVLEETGYVSDKISFMWKFPTSQGLTDEIVDCYVMKNAKQKSKKLVLDSAECIEVLIIPLKKLKFFLLESIKSGMLVDPKIFVALSVLI